MPDILNPSFEDAGALVGQALSWTVTYPAGEEDFASFTGVSRNYPWEGYEELWQDNQDWQAAFGTGDLLPALFEGGTLVQEAFDYSWMEPALPYAPYTLPRWNHHSQWVRDSGNFTVASFDLMVAEGFEDYEEEWADNEGAVADLTGGTTVAASFDVGIPQGFEDFEEEWQSNETSEDEFIPFDPFGAGSVTALFDALANNFENFEGIWTEVLP